MSHGFERMKKDIMTDSNQTSQPAQARSQASFMHHVGNWKCLRCPFEVPYDPSWSIMSDAIQAHYKEQHPYVASNAPAFLADPEPSPAPSQPKLPDYTEEGRKEADTWFAGADKNDQQILFMDWKRLERENQQLRQQVKDVDKSAKSLYLALYQCGVVIEFVPGSPKIRNQRAETAEQQLAQIRKPIDLSEDDIEAATQWCSEIAGESLRKEYIKIDAANRALVRTIAAQETVIRQQQRRLSNLSNDATADQAVFAHIHRILDEAQVPRSQKIEGQKHSLWLTTPRRVEWLVETIAALRLDNAQKEHDVAEWSTVANLGNDRIAAAKAVGVVFTDPGTTCVNQRAEDAEAKVRGLSAEFMCQAELEGGK